MLTGFSGSLIVPSVMSFRNTVFFVLATSLGAAAVAMDGDPRDTRTNGSSGRRVLLFHSGRALEGEITETENHYIVVRPQGKVEIKKGDIEFVATSFDEVYRYKQERLNDRDSDAHIQLALWCLMVNLRERAIEELERSIDLAPDTSRAKGLLESLRRAPKTGDEAARTSAMPEQPAPQSVPTARTYPSYQRELSPAQVSTFSVRIQPLLVRSCGTAHCHDSNHSGSLVLFGSTRPTQKTSQQNLRAVLAHIDAEQPELSPLLRESIRAHGTAHQPPLVAGKNDAAYAKLANWVRAVSGEPIAKSISPTPSTAATPSITPEAQSVTASNPASNDAPTAKSVDSIKAFEQPPARRRAAIAPVTSPDTASAAPPLATELRPPVKADAAVQSNMGSDQPVDPFDPEIFNRQFAPR